MLMKLSQGIPVPQNKTWTNLTIYNLHYLKYARNIIAKINSTGAKATCDM
jgi:hypothetical protein